ncbi:hypothetical protein K501DRAFT_258479, partial [Backusella circina FSU 941]
MSKNQQEYYSYTSPAINSSSSSSNPPPSAPGSEDFAPPSYDEAIIPTTGATLPPNRHNLQGYVLDPGAPPFNPNVPAPTSSNVLQQPFINTGDYGPVESHSDEFHSPLLSNTEPDLFRGRPAPPGYSIYKAKYQINDHGVLSRDKHINNDGEALLQFLYEHNTPPKMAVRFRGYHMETVWRSRTTRDSDGNTIEERNPETTQVEDFSFKIDASSYVSPVCQGMYILPDPKTGQAKSLRELCDEYIHEKNNLKELQLTKEVNWNFAELTRAFTAVIRQNGYYETVVITYELENETIVVKTGSTLSVWSDNRWMRLAVIVSCLWIILFPLFWFIKKRFGHSVLKSAWNMNISERDWYQLNVNEVIANSKRRSGILPNQFIGYS